MSASLRKNEEEQQAAPADKASRPDIQEILVRMLIGMLINYVTRRLRNRQEASHERRRAVKKMDKLAKKGKKIPAGLKKQATEGLSNRQKEKVARSFEKKAATAKGKKAKESKKKGRKLFWLLVIVAAAGLAVKSATRK